MLINLSRIYCTLVHPNTRGDKIFAFDERRGFERGLEEGCHNWQKFHFYCRSPSWSPGKSNPEQGNGKTLPRRNEVFVPLRIRIYCGFMVCHRRPRRPEMAGSVNCYGFVLHTVVGMLWLRSLFAAKSTFGIILFTFVESVQRSNLLTLRFLICWKMKSQKPCHPQTMLPRIPASKHLTNDCVASHPEAKSRTQSRWPSQGVVTPPLLTGSPKGQDWKMTN